MNCERYLHSPENPNLWRYGSIGQTLVPRSLIRISMPDSVAPYPEEPWVLQTGLLGDVAVVEELCPLVGRTLSPSGIPSSEHVGDQVSTAGFGKTEGS